MHIPDRFARTVRILVQITDGMCRRVGGQPLPKLSTNTTAELVLSAYDIADPKELADLTSERTVPLLPKDTTLWARVKEDQIPASLLGHRACKKIWPVEPGLFVSFTLTADLALLIRAGKNAALKECLCHIPSLGAQARSINEAYTKISVAFEPSRRSHTGNAFRCVFYEKDKTLLPLDDLRLKGESGPEPELGLTYNSK
jgi:hypothetical protein